MRYVLSLAFLFIASLMACCGCGGLLHSAFKMVTSSKYWMTTTGWTSVGVFGILITLAFILGAAALVYFNTANVDEETPSA